MTAPASPGLARVTVAAPRRRLDVALPEGVPVAELLPHLLRHAGEAAADDGERHGGWALRRATGALVESTRTLVAQGVRDGEVLHLVPRRTEWPELAYDDVVEIIAGGARRTGRSWGNVATRRCALAVTAGVLGLGLAGVLVSGPPWQLPGAMALGFALTLTVVGIVLARAVADAVAGAIVAGCGLPYAAVGGLLVTAPDGTALRHLGAPHLVLGSVALLLFGVVAYVGVSALARMFVAAIAVGLLGALAGLLCLAGASPAGAAAIVLTVALGLLPGYPLISVWLGRLPVPPLPQRPEEMLEDRPVPPRSEVFAAVTRAHELLTGMLIGAAVVAGVCFVPLLAAGHAVPVLLAGVGAVALLLRARLFPTPIQRVPMMVSGLLGLTVLTLGAALRLPVLARLLVLLILVAVAAGVILATGLSSSRRPPSPYLGRAADILDVVAIMALLPLAFGVAGLYGALQGMFASVG